MKKIIIFTIGTLFIPTQIFASDQFVTCGGSDCSMCSLLKTVSNVFYYLMTISAVVSILLLCLSGLFYIFTIGNKDKEKTIKKAFYSSIVGFALTLLSFLVIYFVFNLSQAKNYQSWYQFECIENAPTSYIPPDLSIIDSSEYPDSEYLKDFPESIVSSGNVYNIATKEKYITKLDFTRIDPNNLMLDIAGLNSARRLKIVAASKNTPLSEIIEFRNVNLGYDKEKSKEYNFLNSDDFLGLSNNLTKDNDKIKEIMDIAVTDASTILNGKGDFNQYSNEFLNVSDNKELQKVFNKFVEQIMSTLLEDRDIYVYANGNSNEESEAEMCYDSGGDWIEFHNQCFIDREKYGKENLACSDIYNPVTGCDCPRGRSLRNKKCVKSKSYEDKDSQKNSNKNDNLINDSDRDGISDDLDACVGTSEGAVIYKDKNGPFHGCSCEQIPLQEITCPPTRCEGGNLAIYPEKVGDKCVIQGNSLTIKTESCVPKIEYNNSRCAELADQKTLEDKEEKAKEDKEFYDRIKKWLDDMKKQQEGGGSSGEGGNNGGGSTSDTGGNTGGGTGGDTGNTGNGDNSSTPVTDLGPKTYNPTQLFKSIKECIGLKDDQIPYNGLLVALLNPQDPLNKTTPQNVSKILYLARDGTIIGRAGDKTGQLGPQEYGANTFKKGTDNNSMWGRGWKIFNGQTKYWKGGWTDQCSFGSHDGYKTGTSGDPLNVNNLKGGKVSSVARCGEHLGTRNNSAGCATLGGKDRCGFINGSKQYMSRSNGTVMQINFIGQIDPSGTKVLSNDCGKIDYCGGKRSFQNSGANRFRNDPNEGYDTGDKRRIEC